MTTGVDMLIESLGDSKIVFGLEQQGHIPTIEKMLKNGATWDEIGKKINWCVETAKEHYMRYTKMKFKKVETVKLEMSMDEFNAVMDIIDLYGARIQPSLGEAANARALYRKLREHAHTEQREQGNDTSEH